MKAFITIGFLFLLVLHFQLNAQSSKDHWFFGPGQGIQFENGNPKAIEEPVLQAFIGCVSMSDSSGNLLFYSNGGAFYNRRHQKMPNSTGLTTPFTVDVIAMPSTTDPNIYHVYSLHFDVINYYQIDMAADGGLGDVGSREEIRGTRSLRAVTAVKNYRDNGYWILTADRLGRDAEFTVWKADGTTGALERHSSLRETLNINPLVWEMVTSPNGEQVSITTRFGLYVLDFDPDCGKFKTVREMPLPGTQQAPIGVCYSPNGQYLYVSYIDGDFPGEGRLYQLRVDDLEDEEWMENPFNTTYGIKGMLAGPDDRIYIVTNKVEDGKLGLDRLNQPNEVWGTVSYTSRVLELSSDVTYNPNFPNFILDNRSRLKSAEQPISDEFVFCEGEQIRLGVKEDFRYDSLFLIDLEQGETQLLNGLKEFVSVPLEVGNHSYKVSWATCNTWQEAEVLIKVEQQPELLLTDTALCQGESLLLDLVDSGITRKVEFLEAGNWRTLDSSQRLDKETQYRLTHSTNACEVLDSFDLSFYEALLTELKGEHSFCEKAGNTVLLDAGPKFNTYKWYPTLDSAQWINVKNAGDYYVVVSDSKGCIGRGDALVESDCATTIFIPNAFSPNGDGLNDFFQIIGEHLSLDRVVVYDRWGAVVHFDDQESSPWDGSKNGETLPLGVYLYTVTYHNTYENAQPKTLIGKVHLVR